MASVSADVLRRSGEEEGNNAHMEQETLVDPAQHGAGSVPAANSAANIPEGHNGPRGEQPEHSEEEIRNQQQPPPRRAAPLRPVSRHASRRLV